MSAAVEAVQPDVLFGSPDLRVGLLQHGFEQLLLAAKVEVDHPLRGLGADGDVVDPRPAQTTVRELAAGNVKDVLAGPLGVLASPGVSAAIGLLRAAGAMRAAASVAPRPLGTSSLRREACR